MPTVCPGCHRQFTPSGYLSHLIQTRQARCIRVREEHEAQGLFALQEMAVDDEDDEEDAQAEDAAPQAFGGDYFGDYAPEEFDDFDNYQDGDEDDDEPDDEPDGIHTQEDLDNDDNIDDNDDGSQDAQNYEDETAWEPPPSTPPRHAHSPLPPEPAGQANEQADNEEHRQAQEDRVQQERARQHLQQRQTFCVKFPGNTAGMPLSDARSPTEYESFKTATEGASSNPYAPFASKVDWEFARWAKMRGPGSTAVTELLSISEVCFRLSHLSPTL